MYVRLPYEQVGPDNENLGFPSGSYDWSRFGRMAATTTSGALQVERSLFKYASNFGDLGAGATKYLKVVTRVGAAANGISVAVSFYEIGTGEKELFGEGGLDLIMGAVGFIPGWGTAISFTYFVVAKPLYNYYSRPR